MKCCFLKKIMQSKNNAINSSSDLHMVVELSNDIWFNDKIHVIRNPFC